MLHGEIIYESGSLREFIGGTSETTVYDNYVSHVSEGIADEGYNDYGPTWLDVQTNGFGDYTIIPQGSPIHTHWESIVNALLQSDTTTADQLLTDLLASYNYDLVWFVDTTLSQPFIMIRERLDMSYTDINLPAFPDDDVHGSFRNGWGLYIINPNATRQQVVFEVPHPCDDFISPYIGIEAFLQTDARAILFAGAGRELKWTEEGNYTNNKSLSDPSRNSNTVFHTFHRLITETLWNEGIHSPIVFQFHSFDNGSHEGLNSIIVSAGALHSIANKPIRDISSEHNDIINFTDEITIYGGAFGPHGMVRVDNYYEVFYDYDFHYWGEYGTYNIKKATELKGSSTNVQLNQTHSLHNGRDVYEPFVHVEFDEKPQIFDYLEMPLDTLYAGDYPTSYNNFSILLEYYQPFLNAVEDYLVYWETTIDVTSPDTVSLFYPTAILPDVSSFRWNPVEDTNFKSYRLYFDETEITTGSPYLDREDYPILADMRADRLTISNDLLPDTCYVAIASDDYFENASGFSENVLNYFEGHGFPITIESFEDTNLVFGSYGDEDVDPDAWQIDTLENGNMTLSLTGNTWKTQSIDPYPLDSSSVWSVNMKIDTVGEIQGIGFKDADHVLWYGLAGTEVLDIDEWVTVYQGYFRLNQWFTVQLPIGDDWVARFDSLPEINEIIYVNDADASDPGVIRFNSIVDLTPDQYTPPIVTIHHDVGTMRRQGRTRNVDVSFWAEIDDPDSYVFTYNWHFGDGEISTNENPTHNYSAMDDHTYSVILEVIDQQGAIGRGFTEITVDEGESSLPLTMNFVGDIMMARRMEEDGGVIPILGVEALFEPTLDILGNAADLTIANLECPLTDEGEPHPTKPIVFRGSPDNVDGLVYAGIDIVTLANNHSMDYGIEGQTQTQHVLNDVGILHSGAGNNSIQASDPLILSRKGVSLAFLASSDRTGQYNNYQPYLNAGLSKPGFAYMTPYNIRQQIQEVRDVVDLVIMEFHAGSEYSVEPGLDYDNYEPGDDFGEQRVSRTASYGISDPIAEDEDYSHRINVPHLWDREIRQFALDEGADVVIVHHPHKVHGIEVHNGKLIAHSLGNFVFDMNYPETMPTVILNADAEPDGFTAFSLTPAFLDGYITKPATGQLGLYILDDIAMKSYNLDSYIHVDRFTNEAHVVLYPIYMPQYQIPNRRTFEMVNGYSKPISIHETGGISLMNMVEPDNVMDMRFGRELIWYGNFENEGANLWNANSEDELIVDNESQDGSRSLFHRRIPSSGDNVVTNLVHRLPIKPGIPISLSGWIKTINGSNVSIQIRFYQTRYSSAILQEDDLGFWITGDSTWTFYSNNIDVPGNAEFFDIRCNSDMPASGEAHSWFDNVSVIQWETWLPVGGDMVIPHPNDYYAMQLSSEPQDTTGFVDYYETYLAYPPTPIPDFEAENRISQVPSTIRFENTSSGLHGWWEWDFGDGSTSIEKNPSHLYTQPGFYDVSLSILDHNNNLQTTTYYGYIVCLSDSLPMAGDINFDGTINILDMLACINIIFENINMTPDQFVAADVNFDFKIDIYDLLNITDIIFLNRSATHIESTKEISYKMNNKRI